ncbi:MAG: molybdopterin converting factor subunit 1 [SAR202 cluster bacterium]|nr:molybdopterin converting factor subunit 1 [SAR202 cluster bacterium]
MRVAVKLFAIARDRAGTSQAWLELPADAAVADALEELGRCFPKLHPVLTRAMFAVNREYAQRDHLLCDGDELAVIPPVSGGALLAHQGSCSYHSGRGEESVSRSGLRGTV